MDPSSFYRLNEALADELARLVASGALAPLQELLAASGSELALTALRPREGLEELLGVLRPGAQPAGPGASAPLVPEEPPQADEAGCGCGPTQPAPADTEARGGFDFESFLSLRSRFVIEDEAGPREVYMPDHVCPRCLNEEGNHLDTCARVCAACAFSW